MSTTLPIPALASALPHLARLAAPPPPTVPLDLPRLRVTTLGPASGGSTLADVHHVLGRGANIIDAQHLVCFPGYEFCTYEPQIMTLAAMVDQAQHVGRGGGQGHVLVVYRGGGIDYSRSLRSIDADRNALLQLAIQLTNLGVIVVFGMGHASDSCLPPGYLPLGIIEEITPSSACERILRDLVSAGESAAPIAPGGG
ncbi:hypothetical protein LK459_07400 [Gordonia otitidis]|uniref:hypothetical protein n=1 Tax=Gordonia otitidis TaxID=249058 RepID=UPI001D14F8CE|nr:hypothetical protein [Gordonia otitidis]UEA60649.1 hypothetical protein LK459_07400 [Gordonia otitidis]